MCWVVKSPQVDRPADTLLSPKLGSSANRPFHVHSFVTTYKEKLPSSLRVRQSNGSIDGRFEPWFSSTMSLPFSSVKCHVIRRMESSTHFSLHGTILSMHVSRAARSPRGTSAPPQSSDTLTTLYRISSTFHFPGTDPRRGDLPSTERHATRCEIHNGLGACSWVWRWRIPPKLRRWRECIVAFRIQRRRQR